MSGPSSRSAVVRRMTLRLLLENIDETSSSGFAVEEIRELGVDILMDVLSDIAELAASSLLQLHGFDEVRAILDRLIVAGLEAEVGVPDP